PLLPRLKIGGLFLADLEERIARERIHRLHPSAEQDRQPAELGVLKTVFLRLAKRAEKPRGHDAGQNDWKPFLHAGFRFNMKPIKCDINCTTRPVATMMHPAYGVSQPGLRTTCNTDDGRRPALVAASPASIWNW